MRALCSGRRSRRFKSCHADFSLKIRAFLKARIFLLSFFYWRFRRGEDFLTGKKGVCQGLKRGRSNKVPTKFKIMYAKGFLKGVLGKNTIWNIWTWFKGNIEGYRVSNSRLEFKIYIRHCQSVSKISTFLCYKNVCIEMNTGIFIF